MISAGVVLIILAAVVGSSALTAAFAWMIFRTRELGAGDSNAELLRLGEEIDSLRAELQVTHADISDLTERVDFTERLLSPGEDPES